MSSFKVRFISEKENDLKTYVVNSMAKEKWRPGLEDINSFFACDPRGLFIGELNGRPIGFLTLLKYDQSYCRFSTYIIEKDFRGKGYGMSLYKSALESVLPSHNISAYAFDDMLQRYVEKSGFQAHWSTPRYDVDLIAAAKSLSQLPLSDVYRVQTVDQIDKQALFNYDASVFGYQRHKFLQTFLRGEGRHSRVAINEEGDIVGYTSARVAFIKEEGYRLGPLYADSLEIAQVLLKALFEEMLEKGMSSSHSVMAEVPTGKNAEAKKLIESLDGKVMCNMTFITTQGIPKGRFENCFAIAGAEFD